MLRLFAKLFRKGETPMGEYTTVQLAAIVEKSERTIQLWIQHGKLPAQHLQGNLYEVAEEDIARFLPHEVVNDLVARIAAIEQRLERIEGLQQQPTPRPPAPRASQGDTLPEGLTLIRPLIKQYSLPETTVINAMRPYLKTGTWKVNGHSVNNALDSAGIEEFERRYGSK
jgi:hypothetical protein